VKQDEIERFEEGALALAQATIQKAMTVEGITQKGLATRMNRSTTFVKRMLEGDHNLPVKTLAAALACCGYEVRFTLRKLGTKSDDDPEA